MDYRIEQITEQLETDVSRFPRVALAARELNISVSRFHHLFKQEMAVSFVQYVKEKKLEAAEVLLKTTHLSVKEIVVKVGGGDETNFIRAFKRRFHETPSEYRKNHWIKHIY